LKEDKEKIALRFNRAGMAEENANTFADAIINADFASSIEAPSSTSRAGMSSRGPGSVDE